MADLQAVEVCQVCQHVQQLVAALQAVEVCQVVQQLVERLVELLCR